MQELLKFKVLWGRPYVLVRWVRHDASGDTWEPLDNLTNFEEAIAAFERATSRSLPRRARPPPIPPTGFTVDLRPPGDLGAALVGRTMLYWWPEDARPTKSAASARRSDFQFGRWLVTGWAFGPARVGGRCGNRHLEDCSVIRSVAFLWLQRTAVATAVLYRASPIDAGEEI